MDTVKTRVAQNVAGLVDFLEPVLGPGIVPVRIRVVAKRQFPVGELDFARIRTPRDPKNFVVVFLPHRLIYTRFIRAGV